MTFQDDNRNIIEVEGDIAMTKQSVSFFNGEISGDVSVNFTVDSNSVNKKILGYNGPQMVNQVAFTKQQFNRISDGNTLDRGYIIIQNDDGNNLDCFYISGNSNWIKSLSGLITDLRWDGYEQIITVPNIQARKSATEGVIFPYIDWAYDLKKAVNAMFVNGFSDPIAGAGNDVLTWDATYNPDVTFVDFFPCLYMQTLVKEILSQNGIKLNGNILDDPLFKTTIITPSSGLFKRRQFNTFTAYGSSQLVLLVGGISAYTNYTTLVNNDNSLVRYSSGIFTAVKSKSLVFTITLTSSDTFPIDINLQRIGTGGPVMSKNFTSPGTFTGTVTAAKDDAFRIYVTVIPTISVNITIQSAEIVKAYDYASPADFLPKLTCLDVIKFWINYPGCATYFDGVSNSLTINIIEKLRLEDAIDYSNYYVSHSSNYAINRGANNYIRLSQSNDTIRVSTYNKINKIGFGEGNIQTRNNILQESEMFRHVFAPTDFAQDLAGIWQANVPLLNLVDDGDPIPFTSMATVASNQTKLSFGAVGVYSFKRGELIRISGSDGTNLGYVQVTDFIDPDLYFFYQSIGTVSGNLYKQRIVFNEIVPRILVNKPSLPYSYFASSLSGSKPLNKTGFYFLSNGGSTGSGTSGYEENIAYSYFTKSLTTEPIDQLKDNLAIDNPIGNFSDPTIKELYLNKISNFMGNPDITVTLLLPEHEYKNYKFDSFIRIKTAQLTGYFFPASIENYVNGKTPVQVPMYML